MLANLNDILVPARENGYCVAHFNVISMEMARGVIAAAEEVGAPVILGIEEAQLSICPMDEFASFAIPMARKADVPVAIHFDRGRSYEKCIEALKREFTSVNYDCSMESFEQNVSRVSALAQFAHAAGAAVEAELGVTPDAAALQDAAASQWFTNPEEAAEYVRTTGVDALAVSVGTGHGRYLSKPEIDYDRIRAISDATGIPLVLHGGSGLSDSSVRRAVASGISKIDIFTDVNIACCHGAIQAINDGVHLTTEMIPYQVHAVKAFAGEKIRIFMNR